MKPSPPPPEKHFDGSGGKLWLRGGIGGMGGAQPLAATMAGAAFLGIEVDPAASRSASYGLLRPHGRHPRRSAGTWTRPAAAGEPLSIGLVGNCADVIPEMAAAAWSPTSLTDQTSAHDPLNGYIPQRPDRRRCRRVARSADPKQYQERALDSIAVHVRAMLDLRAGAP